MNEKYSANSNKFLLSSKWDMRLNRGDFGNGGIEVDSYDSSWNLEQFTVHVLTISTHGKDSNIPSLWSLEKCNCIVYFSHIFQVSPPKGSNIKDEDSVKDLVWMVIADSWTRTKTNIIKIKCVCSVHIILCSSGCFVRS